MTQRETQRLIHDEQQAALDDLVDVDAMLSDGIDPDDYLDSYDTMDDYAEHALTADDLFPRDVLRGDYD